MSFSVQTQRSEEDHWTTGKSGHQDLVQMSACEKHSINKI